MRFEVWYVVLGALLVGIALVSSIVKRLPLTTTMLYLGVGVVMGPMVMNLGSFDPLGGSRWLERLTEFAVIVSLFTAGLKLGGRRAGLNWRIPLRLAITSMTLTVGMVALAGVWLLGLPLGAAILLGAILSPTDPVLASEVQLESPTDRDRLRFSLTGEAGLNDGSAFPFVMLGLGLLGLNDLGEWGWRWLAVDVVWAVTAGVLIGAGSGIIVGQIVIHFRRERKEGFGLDEFLTIGVIGLSYGTAVLVHAYGFLAVFAAGVALRVIEQKRTPAPALKEEAAGEAAGQNCLPGPDGHSRGLVQSVMTFNEQIEHVLEVGLVLLIGTMLAPPFLNTANWWFVPLLLLVIRPVAVFLGLVGCSADRNQRMMIGWFGIRGIGSLYYLTYALNHGVTGNIAQQLVSFTLWTVAVSVVVHGISVTPLMDLYQARQGSQRRRVSDHL